MGEMNSKSLQTKPNLSDYGAIVHRRLICKKELAKELSVSPRTIDNWVRKKRIPVHRFTPRLLRYDLRKVQAALDKYEVIELGRKLS
jgi:Helix-turn-helix domain